MVNVGGKSRSLQLLDWFKANLQVMGYAGAGQGMLFDVVNVGDTVAWTALEAHAGAKS